MEELITYHPSRIYIYCLLDPRDESVFYVGQTNQPHARLHGHVINATNENTWHKRKNKPMLEYMRSMSKQGHYPSMLLLCSVEGKDHAKVLEHKTIVHFRSIGFPLFNATKYADV